MIHARIPSQTPFRFLYLLLSSSPFPRTFSSSFASRIIVNLSFRTSPLSTLARSNFDYVHVAAAAVLAVVDEPNGMTAAGARAGLENSAWMHSGRPRERASDGARGHAKAVRSVGGCRRTGGRCSRSQSLSLSLPSLSLVWRLQGVRASRLLHFMNQIIFAS